MTADEEARRILDIWERSPMAEFDPEGATVVAYARRLEAGMRALDAEIVRLRTERNEWGEQALGMVAVEKDLNARIAAARNHIEQAKLWTDSGDECAVHLRWAEMALDVEEVGA